MDKFGCILGTIVFFLFPIPFLLDFAVSQGNDWTAWLAYAAIATLAAGATATAVIASRR
jgi:hypothetical protein